MSFVFYFRLKAPINTHYIDRLEIGALGHISPSRLYQTPQQIKQPASQIGAISHNLQYKEV